MQRYPEELVLAAAHFYYVEGFTQEETAMRLNVPRVRVTRLLKRAREDGFVEVIVKKPIPQLYKLSLELERKYALRYVHVTRTGTTAKETLEGIGRAGAELLGSLIRPGCRIGVAWSRTVSCFLPYIRKAADTFECTVNDLAGTYLAPNVPFSVSWPLAEKIGAKIESIPLPVLVQNNEAKQSMLNEEMIKQALNNALRVDFAFVGLGEVSENSSLAQTGYISEEHIREIEAKQAVGEILMRYYNAKGEHINTSFDSRIIALEWEEIKKIPVVIAMAAGHNKIDAIKGALQGRIIQGLVTDRETAEILLTEDPVKSLPKGKGEY